jgi:hypothetical protein
MRVPGQFPVRSPSRMTYFGVTRASRGTSTKMSIQHRDTSLFFSCSWPQKIALTSRLPEQQKLSCLYMTV